MPLNAAVPGLPLELIGSAANGDYDLATGANVYQATPSATEAMRCQAIILVGDGTKDLTGVAGNFELTLTLGSNVCEPGPQVIAAGTNTRSTYKTAEFICPANTQVTIALKSPHAGDADVDVTVEMYRLPG